MSHVVHHIILVPGLADNFEMMDWLTKGWTKDVRVHIHTAWWLDTKPLQPKLKKLVSLIDTLSTRKNKLSLIGVSAGGSMVINAYAKRKDKIYRVINICGRTRNAEKDYPDLDQIAKQKTAYMESLILCEKAIASFTRNDRKKILTFRGMYDESVSPHVTPIKGAINKRIPFALHLINIWAIFTFYRHTILNFIQ